MSTQSIEEHADLQDVSYIREEWQDKLTDSSWTITEEEAQELLKKAKGSVHTILQAIENTLIVLRQKNQKPTDYFQEELLIEVGNQIEQITRAKESRDGALRTAKGHRAASYSTIAGLIKELSQRIPGHVASESEVLSFYEQAKGRTNIVLQAMRTVGAFVKSRKFTHPSHAEVIQRILGKIAHEMKLVNDFTNKSSGAKNAIATNCETF
jgi:hypothetical protein